MQFLKMGYEIGKPIAKEILKQSVKQTAKAAPAILRPAVQFGRAAITGTPKATSLNAYGATTTYIGVSTRAGMQFNKAVKVSAYAAATKAPRLALGAAKMGARIAFKDAFVNPIYNPLAFGYGVFRARRLQRGASVALERYADRMFKGTSTFLARYRVAPSNRGDVAGLARYALYVSIYKHVSDSTVGDKISEYAGKLNNQYEGLKTRARGYIDALPTVGAQQDQPVIGPPVVGPAPPAPPVLLPPAAPPPAPPPPVIVPPVYNRRRR